jgi:hypothetical protein
MGVEEATPKCRGARRTQAWPRRLVGATMGQMAK